METRVRLTIQYDGTDFAGWQKQVVTSRTVQGTIEQVLMDICGVGRLTAAGRTDAGVHARGQEALWLGNCAVPVERLASVLNRRLPSDIRVVRALHAPGTWDPQRDAIAKQYSYRLWAGQGFCAPWQERTVYVPSRIIDWHGLQEAAKLFVGTHDFWAFRSEGSTAQTSVRTILASQWVVEDQGQIWRYYVVGRGFLYHMVRIMVGAMMQAAQSGTIDPIQRALDHPRLGKAAPVAPAHGLMLDWIAYR